MNLGKRPSPEKISFDASCFKTVGTENRYTVINPNGYGYPKEFTNPEQAQSYANKTGQTVFKVIKNVQERISWTAEGWIK